VERIPIGDLVFGEFVRCSALVFRCPKTAFGVEKLNEFNGLGDE